MPFFQSVKSCLAILLPSARFKYSYHWCLHSNIILFKLKIFNLSLIHISLRALSLRQFYWSRSLTRASSCIHALTCLFFCFTTGGDSSTREQLDRPLNLISSNTVCKKYCTDTYSDVNVTDRLIGEKSTVLSRVHDIWKKKQIGLCNNVCRAPFRCTNSRSDTV